MAHPGPISASRQPCQLWLLAMSALTLAPHAPFLPAWLGMLCAGLIIVRATQLRFDRLRVPQLVVILIAFATAIGVKLDFGHFFGKDPGIALLAVLLGLKLIEVRASRDVYVAVLLCLFLLLGLFFEDQSILAGVLALAGFVLALCTLLSQQDAAAPAGAQLKAAASLLFQATPLFVVLFFLFPRVPGPLWGLPSDAFSSMTGLSDTMRPGSISQLSLSEAIAFRVEFDGAPPPPAQRYWRGPVLTRFDGQVWHPVFSPVTDTPQYSVTGSGFGYRLTMEAHNRRWLFALEFPDRAPTGARFSRDNRLLLQSPLHQRARFELRSYPATATGQDEDQHRLTEALRLPANSNPRSLELARRIADDATHPKEILDRVLAEMKTLDLTYTLEPPLLGTHSVDEFLFDTRLGFCEHFAAAFVVLMRAAEVPARVVTGYQGGEINPVDGSLVVRQSDAHAWAEVWLPQRGWVRVDPTALAAPQRIESGLTAALPRDGDLRGLMRPAADLLLSIRYHWEALTNAWNQSVLGYNDEVQRDLFKELGFREPDWRLLSTLLGASAATVLLALFAWSLRRHRRGEHLDRLWQIFCRRLAHKGLARMAWEGPIDYAERAAAAFPREARTIRMIAHHYARLRYATTGKPDQGALRQFSVLIRSLRFSKKTDDDRKPAKS